MKLNLICNTLYLYLIQKDDIRKYELTNKDSIWDDPKL